MKKKEQKAKVLRYVTAKGKNKRIEILLYEREDKSKVFTVSTKTLQDFKTRNILRTDNVYSVETFMLLSQFMDMFMRDSEVINKIIHREVDKIQKFQAWSNLGGNNQLTK